MSEAPDSNGTRAASGRPAAIEPAPTAREVLRFVAGYWRQVPFRFAAMLIGVAIGIAIEAQIPRFSASLVAAIERVLAGSAEGRTAWRAAAWLVGAFAAVFVVKQLYLRNWMHLASQVMQRLVADGFQRVQRYSADWHTSHFAGATQRKVTRGMWAYDMLADTLVIDLGPGIGLLVTLTGAMWLRDVWLGAYFGAAVVAFVAVSILLALRYVAPANVRSNQADTEVGAALADAISCNAVVKSFGAEGREDERFGDVSQRWRAAARRSWLRSMDAGAVQSLLLIVLLGGLLGLVLFRPHSAQRKVEDATYVIATYLVVQGYLRNIGQQVRSAQRGINELDDLVAFSRTEPQVRNLPGAPDFRRGAGEIRFESVRFGYRNHRQPLFDGLSVVIRAGEKVALVGESGGGKSSFVKLLQRLYDVDGGRVLVDGQDVARVTQESLRRAISVVPQEPILFHRTLAENVAYGRPAASRAEVVDAARRAHAHEFISKLAEGYETLVGERGIKLSGGERQRIAIARAILADAPILVLDEATSSVDSLTERMIQDALTTLMQGRTAVVVAHRLSTIRQVDRILVFDAGRIVEEGSHAALMARPAGHYRRLVEMQALGLIDDVAVDAGEVGQSAAS